MDKKGYSLLQVIVIIIATSIISGIATGVILTKGHVSTGGLSYAELLEDKAIQEFLDVYSELKTSYYEKVDGNQIIQSAINGMTNYLNDTYTSYLDGDQANDLMEQLNGKYEGIGITIKDAQIISVMKNSPAEEAGLLMGDVISKVNDIDVSTKKSSEISSLIKGNDANAKLEILRNNETMVFNISLKTLNIPSVAYEVIENTKIGYLQITIFSGTLTEQVKDALKELQKLGIEKIIIDVRDNTGGYLEQAYETAQLFLKKNQTIYSLVDKKETIKYKDKDNNATSYPMVVLINGQSASASEIIAGAFKDSYGATLVGTTSYGKGKVQHTYKMSDGGLVKYTSSKWLRPNGECIDQIGLTPDYMVENEYKYEDDRKEIITGVFDRQLEKAVELLSK